MDNKTDWHLWISDSFEEGSRVGASPFFWTINAFELVVGNPFILGWEPPFPKFLDPPLDYLYIALLSTTVKIGLAEY